MITHVRIQNLRSLVDTGFIEIKPLTILLGSNSSGKSTFLRSFPLFKQSVDKELREPISWFDESLVDFGDYSTAKSKLVPIDDGIMFSYRMKVPFRFIESFYYYRRTKEIYRSFNTNEFLDCGDVEISFSHDEKGTYVDSVTVTHPNLSVKMCIAARGEVVRYFVNGEQILNDCGGHWTYGPELHILPEFEIKRNAADKNRTEEGEIHTYIESILRRHCSKRLNNEEKIDRLMKGWKKDKQEYLNYLRTQKLVATLRNNAQNWDADNEDFTKIYKAVAVLNLISSTHIIESEMRSLYKGCSYIAPTRAAANRYYRTQGLQVLDVDPYGKNLQEFICSLDDEMKASYEEFTKRVLGLKIKVEEVAGHQSIELESEFGKVNMTDVGFGYSQILPIITKFWYTNYKFKNQFDDIAFLRDGNDIMLIEQPELHLHPAMQAATADAMMLVLNEVKKSIEEHIEEMEKHQLFQRVSPRSALIVETHSQAMINRIGKRIREKRFKAEDVSILMFEKDANTGETKIRPVKFGEDGRLSNWPYGFFDPKDNDYDILFDRQSQTKGE